MPARRKRPLPPARMIELLTAEKQRWLGRTITVGHDDPLLAERAIRLDRRRSDVRNDLDAWRLDRQDLAQQIVDGVQPDDGRLAEITLRIVALEVDLATIDGEFAQLLSLLPRMRAFEAAWERSWTVMVAERAWPHATEHRRQWRVAMLATKPEARAAFLGLSTPYSRWHHEVMTAVDDRSGHGEDVVVGFAVA